jgi:hypothetical protein
MEIVRPVGWRKVLRVAIFLLIGGFISFGPCHRQAFDGRGELPFGLEVDRRLFRQWVMFSGFGIDVCDVRYSQQTSGGEALFVDRFEVLDHPVWAKAPKTLRRIKSAQAAVSIGRQLCRVLEREKDIVDLRVVARCGSKKGWVDQLDGEENLCTLPLKWKHKGRK